MAEQKNRNDQDQDQRAGGYGGSTGGQSPDAEPAGGQGGTSAAGRDSSVRSDEDADEALGNRSGGYGSGGDGTGA